MRKHLDRVRFLATSLLRRQSGVTSIEYALIGVLIAILIITGVTAVGTSVSSMFHSVGAGL